MELDDLDDLLGPRQMRNCLPCKQRKIKCDRKIPCGPCALRKDAKSCSPELSKLKDLASRDSLGLGDRSVTASEFQVLVKRVKSLQDKVTELESTVKASSAPGPGSTAGTRGHTPPLGNLSPPGTVTSRRHQADDEMVFALEDFQMSHRINAMRNIESPSDTSREMAGGSSMGSITNDHPLSFLVPPGTDYLAKAMAALPDEGTCQFLVQSYFDHVEWFQRCLHQPTFMAQCRQLWSGDLPLDPDLVATYLMVVCLGLRTVVDTLPGMSNALGVAENLYHVAEGVLWTSRFLHRQTFESLQAISLMSVYGFGTESGTDATWALCGSAVKIAQNLGLNRLEAEAKGKVWSPLWRSRLRRELGRRVWWTFVALDWSNAIAHGSTYQVLPAQNLSALPSNLRDEQLDDDEAVELPLTTYTPISMQIFRFKFVLLYREITDHMASHPNPSYSFILRMDDSIIELASSLPQHFETPTSPTSPSSELSPATPDPALLIDALFLNMQANIRLLRLHRPFFLRGYQDPRYKRSKTRCVSSSRTVLDLIAIARNRVPHLLSFWIVLFYAFSAAVPVCIDLFFDPSPDKREAVAAILDTFREHAPSSSAARNSVYVLERLLELEAQFREQHEDERKRGRDGDGEEPSSKRRKHSGPTRKQAEQLRASIRSILESAAFQQQRTLAPAPVVMASGTVGGGTTDSSAQSESSFPLSLTPTFALDDVWPSSSFDTLDTLWAQSEGIAWPSL